MTFLETLCTIYGLNSQQLARVEQLKEDAEIRQALAEFEGGE